MIGHMIGHMVFRQKYTLVVKKWDDFNIQPSLQCIRI